MRYLRWLLLFLTSVAGAQTYYNQTTIPPTIAAYTILGNATGSVAAPQQLTSLPFGVTNCTANIVNPGTVAANTVCQYNVFAMTGTQSVNARFAPLFAGITDTYDGSVNVTSNVNSYSIINYNLGAGFNGYRDLTTNTLSITGAPTDATQFTKSYVNEQLYTRSNGINVGGTDLNLADAAGALWGTDVSVITQSGATNFQTLYNHEVDLNMNTGSSSVSRVGMAMYSSAGNNVRGSLADAFILFGRSTAATTGLKTGLQVGSFNSDAPFDSDSKIFSVVAKMGVSSYVAPVADYWTDARQLVPTSGFMAFLNSGIDQVGNVYGGNLYSAGSLSAQTAIVASIAASAYGGVTGGAYFANAAFPTISIAAPPNSGTNATATVATMKLTKALLVPGTDSGCTNGDVLTLTGGGGTQATVTLTVVAGAATAAAVTTAGSYTATSATPGTTGGTCSVQPEINLGFGIATVTVNNAGTGYPSYPLPVINLTGAGVVHSTNRNTPAVLIPTMTVSNGTLTVGQNGASPGAIALLGPVSFQAGTSYSGASWGATSPVWNGVAMTLNDTTASGTVTKDSGYTLQAVNFTSTGAGATTITTGATLDVAAPTCSGGVICTNLYAINAVGKINATGQILSGAGANFNSGTVNINASSNNTTNINSGTSNSTLTLGGTTAGNIVNLASVNNRVGNVLYSSVTAPTINAHFNTSGDSIIASSTAAFQVTVGTGGGTTTGSVTLPTATNGWACSVADVTTPATNMVQQTGSTTTGVTVTNYVRTTGVAGNFTNSDKLNFICGAF